MASLLIASTGGAHRLAWKDAAALGPAPRLARPWPAAVAAPAPLLRSFSSLLATAAPSLLIFIHSSLLRGMIDRVRPGWMGCAFFFFFEGRSGDPASI